MRSKSPIATIEILKPSCPNPRDPITVQLVAALEECIAYMDSPCRTDGHDLVAAILRDARRVLRDARGPTN